MGSHACVSSALEIWFPLKGTWVADKIRCFVSSQTDRAGSFFYTNRTNYFFPRWGSEWMLDSFQTKSRSSSEPRRFKSVSTLNIWRAFVLPCLHSVGRFKFFQWNIWGLFDSKGKAAIWGLIPPKSPVLLWMSWRVSGKFIPFPLLTAERWYPPSGSAVFLDPFCYQLCSSFENRYFFFLRLCYRYSDFSESRRGWRYC